jgi:hypothetical protein
MKVSERKQLLAGHFCELLEGLSCLSEGLDVEDVASAFMRAYFCVCHRLGQRQAEYYAKQRQSRKKREKPVKAKDFFAELGIADPKAESLNGKEPA